MKKKILFVSADNFGTGYYRMKMPSAVMAVTSEIFDVKYIVIDGKQKPTKENIEKILSFFDWADLIVFQRHFSGLYEKVLSVRKKARVKVIYDIDDNFWEVSKNSTAKITFPREVLEVAERCLKECDGIVTSTDHLGKYLSRFNTNIVTMPNRLMTLPYLLPKVGNGRVRIGWTGTSTHIPDLELQFTNALIDLRRKYPGKVSLHFVGWMPSIPRELLPEFIPWIDSMTYLEDLNKLRWNIGVAPLINSAFNNSKSNIKYLEYSACGVTPVMSSAALAYKSTIEHNIDGILVPKVSDWYSILEGLVLDSERREKLAANARKKVEALYCYETNIEACKSLDSIYSRFL